MSAFLSSLVTPKSTTEEIAREAQGRLTYLQEAIQSLQDKAASNPGLTTHITTLATDIQDYAARLTAPNVDRSAVKALNEEMKSCKTKVDLLLFSAINTESA